LKGYAFCGPRCERFENNPAAVLPGVFNSPRVAETDPKQLYKRRRV
jgi:hypothetical protein